MRTLSCRNLIVRLGLHGVHKVGELDSVLNEEDGNVISDDIPVSFVRVKLDSETTDVADSVLQRSVKPVTVN